MANHNSKKSLFIRADLNIPLHGTRILDDFKLKTFIPILAHACKEYQKIIISTHQSRPNTFDPRLSTNIHAQWLLDNGFQVTHIPLAETFTAKLDDSIYMLENLRFFQGEQADNPDTRKRFAQQLQSMAEHYLFDAIAVAHRNDTSIALLPCLFSQKNKAMSSHAKNEYGLFNQLGQSQSPKLLILGGIKAKTKLSYIPQLIQSGFTIALCPPLSLSFSPDKAKKLCWNLKEEWIQYAQNVVKMLGTSEKRLILPVDYMLLEQGKNGQEQPFIGLGANTLTFMKTLIKQHKSIIFNGLIGRVDKPKTLVTTQSIFHMLEKMSQEKQIILAGGDTIAAARQLNISESFIHFSTAGGAALAILANKPLPVLRCLRISR